MVRIKGKNKILELLIKYYVDPSFDSKTLVYFYGDFIHVTHPDIPEQKLEDMFRRLRGQT